MVSKLAILCNLLLASVALAIPSSRLESRLARRREARQSLPINHLEQPASDVGVSNVEYSSNWAGAVLIEPAGTFTNGAASAWVGIDGDTCGTAILQTGVDFTLSWWPMSPWYEWYPDYAYDFSGISISLPVTSFKVTVTASSTTSGKAVIQNLSTGPNRHKVSHFVARIFARQMLSGFVEDFEENGGHRPLRRTSALSNSQAVRPPVLMAPTRPLAPPSSTSNRTAKF
ncbi:peptidase A4 family-domain-containing protein [Melanogaster broomeanus]|nr:peptidase A4 family-domain-containing protein [Melanogaster broomeanus]